MGAGGRRREEDHGCGRRRKNGERDSGCGEENGGRIGNKMRNLSLLP